MSKFPKVIFRKEDHSYWYGEGKINSKNRVKMKSVNGVWGLFCEEFNGDLVSVLKSLEYVGVKNVWKTYFSNEAFIKTVDDLTFFFDIDEDIMSNALSVKYQWECANHYGTEFHDMMEQDSYDKGFLINPFDGKEYKVHNLNKKYDNQTVVDDLFELEDGVHPELVVYDSESGTCGQVDVPFIETIDGVRYLDIVDLKTNGGESTEKGLKKRKEISKPRKGKFMKDPVSHLYDCTYTKYQGQLSMYAYLLEKAGFVPRNLAVAHYLNYNPKEEYYIQYDYLQNECKLILNTFINN